MLSGDSEDEVVARPTNKRRKRAVLADDDFSSQEPPPQPLLGSQQSRKRVLAEREEGEGDGNNNNDDGGQRRRVRAAAENDTDEDAEKAATTSSSEEEEEDELSDDGDEALEADAQREADEERRRRCRYVDDAADDDDDDEGGGEEEAVVDAPSEAESQQRLLTEEEPEDDEDDDEAERPPVEAPRRRDDDGAEERARRMGGASSTMSRKDVTQGMGRTDGRELTDDQELWAPLFCLPFHLVDKTSLDPLMQEALWVLHNAASCVEKGEPGSHIRMATRAVRTVMAGESCARVDRSVVVTTDDRRVLPELSLELRIYQAVGAKGASEFYLLLTGRSPLPFSLRHAVYTSLQTLSRGPDGHGADQRRDVWNRLAMHVKSGTGASVREELNVGGLCSSSVEWIKVSNRHSFSVLFSVHTAVEWVRRHFFGLHAEEDTVGLEGFGTLTRGAAVPEGAGAPAYVEAFQRYDDAVNDGIRRTYAKKKKRRRRREAGQQQEDEAEDEEEEVIAAPVPPRGWPLGDRRTGVPRSEIATRASVPLSVEDAPRKGQFLHMVKPFPPSVTVSILQRSMGVELGEELVSVLMGEDCVNGNECLQIMHGREQVLSRPMLANGDASWASGCRAALEGLAGGRQRERLDVLRKMVRVSFSLALTRSLGSDVYVHPLAQAYGQFMERGAERGRAETPSQLDCAAAWRARAGGGGGGPVGCMQTLGFETMVGMVADCNARGWLMRPDNVHLFMHMIVSHVMLSLNFYGSVIEGASNGIGATLLIRNGGGNYRHTSREGVDTTGVQQDYGKVNGSGADMVVNVMKQSTTPGTHEPRHKMRENYMEELKRTSEMGLLMETCNIYEGMGQERALKHCARAAHKRLYSTELRCVNEPSCTTTMQSIVNIIPRNTMADNDNSFKTTREHERSKERVPVEYQVVTNGFFVIASNFVAAGTCKERMKTISNVVRNVPSCASAMDRREGRARDHEADTEAHCNGVVDHSSSASTIMSEAVLQAGRPFLWTALGVAVFTGFMQWTGMLGRLPSCAVVEELTAVFYAQLRFSTGLLNPDMASTGELGRSKQISKARAVAMSLLGEAMHEVLESGRRGSEGQREAVERCALGLTSRCMTPAAVPWMIADTLDHMMRMDMVILLQLAAWRMGVPQGVRLDEVLKLLKQGTGGLTGALAEWWKDKGHYLQTSPVDRRTEAGPLGDQYYVSCDDFRFRLGEGSEGGSLQDFDAGACSVLGRGLYRKFKDKLARNCQITKANLGEDIVRNMLNECCNVAYPWPHVFGGGHISELPGFWLGKPPPPMDTGALDTMPLRIVQTEAAGGVLGVDVRWLLLVAAICKPMPSQASRVLMVAAWVRGFYEHCVPPSMYPSERLFVGLPSPYMLDGFLAPTLRASKRTILRRPADMVSPPAPCPSGVVEDMGPAAPRLQLAAALKVPERELPTDCVAYSFPPRVWFPVEVTARGEDEARVFGGERAFATLLFVPGRGFWLRPRGAERCLRAEAVEGEPSFLEGRLRYDVRPLGLYQRAGTLFRDPVTGMAALLVGYLSARAMYEGTVCNGQSVYLDPYEFDAAVLPLGTTLYLGAAALAANEGACGFAGQWLGYQGHRERGSSDEGGARRRRRFEDLGDRALIRCRLQMTSWRMQERDGLRCTVSVWSQQAGVEGEMCSGGSSVLSSLSFDVDIASVMLTRMPRYTVYNVVLLAGAEAGAAAEEELDEDLARVAPLD